MQYAKTPGFFSIRMHFHCINIGGDLMISVLVVRLNPKGAAGYWTLSPSIVKEELSCRNIAIIKGINAQHIARILVILSKQGYEIIDDLIQLP